MTVATLPPINSLPIDGQIARLESVLSRLSARDAEFATSLIRGFRRYGNLTPRQAPWIARLVDKAENPAAVTSAVEVGPAIKAALERAWAAVQRRVEGTRARPRPPALSFHGANVRFSLAGATARVPGSVNVTSVDKSAADGRRAWIGRIHNGRFAPGSAATPERVAQALEVIREYGHDATGYAARHGQQTGICCFCSKTLTDGRSVAVGYGPVCADNFGLPWGARPALECASTVAPAPAASGNFIMTPVGPGQTDNPFEE